eukprot:CAMPEP_0185192582 /NCGR_PEP_ID=MMETSP1140-20130426/19403_1 /TAXON_ID=298111 /ORGANISM="Pavlova sp., Strain CCMP459" /LENGTH=256 /DNA_ID=CAMNT_0027759337 /DNA_START=44 /DNA_END=814 /DNA_ORIENTATION=-
MTQMTALRLLLAGATVLSASRAQDAAPVSSPPPHHVSHLTPCQECCTPGGSCDHAFHGDKGMCCGSIADQAFCCPYPPTMAMCIKCNLGYKCARAGAVRTQRDAERHCLDLGGAPRSGHSRHGSSNGSEILSSIIAFIVLIMLAYAIYQCCTAATRPQVNQGVQMGAPPPYGYPSQGGYGPGYGGPGYYGGGGGYGGGTVAAAGAAGLVGGMLVGEAIADAGDHGHYGGGGYGDGGYGDGGGFGDGGGDAGFAADS